MKHKRDPWLRAILIVVLSGNILISLFWWFVPLEVFESWAFEAAGADPYKQFEAVGRAEFSCWLIRFASPVFGMGALVLLRNSSRTAVFLANAFNGWIVVTAICGGDRSTRWQTLGFRVLCAAWGLLAFGHAGQAVQDCMTNWPYYQLRSGAQVLPNISDSNRDVIRYLLEATESSSRIFVASDQKLYFLSYYLLPRRLYYKVHPGAEFVVAQPFQQRRMEAYQLSEIDSQTIDRIDPDYILEYFEHPDFVDRNRIHDDQAWLSFYRKARHDPSAKPDYVVCLRRIEKGTHQ